LGGGKSREKKKDSRGLYKSSVKVGRKAFVGSTKSTSGGTEKKKGLIKSINPCLKHAHIEEKKKKVHMGGTRG